MQVEVIPGRDLDAALAGRWREIQAANAELVNPYFAPEFTQIVAAARDDVKVAVITEGGTPVAFFPFQRRTWNVAEPVGGVLSDYHGLVCAPGFACDPLELLRKCKVIAWDFDHLLASQAAFQPYHRFLDESPIIDLSGGFKHYLEGRKASGVKLRSPLRLMRKIEKEVGPLRFESHVDHPDLLRMIMKRKSEQYLRHGKVDLFAEKWIRQTVESVSKTRSDEFGGLVSALYAGPELVASLLSLRSSAVWHGWFLGFEERFARYSPGFLLWLKMAECASACGVAYLDFGKGDPPYKLRLMNGSIGVAGGSLELPSWLSYRRSALRRLRTLVSNSPLGGPIRRLVRLTRRRSGRPD